jgi:hypothetical protein
METPDQTPRDCGPIPEGGPWICAACGCRYPKPLHATCGLGGLLTSDYLRTRVRQRYAQPRPGVLFRPLAGILAEIDRLEREGLLPSGCPTRLDAFAAALLFAARLAT